MQWKQRFAELFSSNYQSLGKQRIIEGELLPAKSLAGRLGAKLCKTKKQLKRNRSDNDLASKDQADTEEPIDSFVPTPRRADTGESPVLPSASMVGRMSKNWHIKEKNNQDRPQTDVSANAVAPQLTEEQRNELLSKRPKCASPLPLPSGSLAGRLKVRKEAARLQLEKQHTQEEFAYFRKQPEGTPMTSRSLAGCLVRREAEDAARRRSADMKQMWDEDNLSKSLVGRLRVLSSCTKTQMNRQANTDGANLSLSATASTFDMDENNAKNFGQHPKELDLVVEMRKALRSRLEDRRVGVKMYTHTFLHSEGLAWLVDRQAKFEEMQCAIDMTRAEQQSAAGELVSPVTKYSRYKDELLEWKASQIGNFIRSAGYIVQISGKDGFKPHRKTNHVFRFNHTAIDRDLQNSKRAKSDPGIRYDNSKTTRVLMVDELSRAKIKEKGFGMQKSVDLFEKHPANFVAGA